MEVEPGQISAIQFQVPPTVTERLKIYSYDIEYCHRTCAKDGWRFMAARDLALGTRRLTWHVPLTLGRTKHGKLRIIGFAKMFIDGRPVRVPVKVWESGMFGTLDRPRDDPNLQISQPVEGHVYRGGMNETIEASLSGPFRVGRWHADLYSVVPGPARYGKPTASSATPAAIPFIVPRDVPDGEYFFWVFASRKPGDHAFGRRSPIFKIVNPRNKAGAVGGGSSITILSPTENAIISKGTHIHVRFRATGFRVGATYHVELYRKDTFVKILGSTRVKEKDFDVGYDLAAEELYRLRLWADDTEGTRRSAMSGYFALVDDPSTGAREIVVGDGEHEVQSDDDEQLEVGNAPRKVVMLSMLHETDGACLATLHWRSLAVLLFSLCL